MKFGKSQGVGRVEDLRFLTGGGRYVDDIAPASALRAWFFRADQAHARIVSMDLAAARQAPGVAAVYGAADLEAMGVALDMVGSQIGTRDGGKGAAPLRPVLAKGAVRHAGEAIALVVADTIEQARDAAELIEIETEALPVALDLAAKGPEIHPEAPGNLAFDYVLGDEKAVEAALKAAAHRVRLRVRHNRIIVAAMEPRGAFAEWDAGRLHLAVNGQGVWVQKRELARMLGLEPEAVRVTNPDVGGGFGMKAMVYPEYTAIAAAARDLGRPVRWMSDRSEAMLTDNAGRDLITETEMGFDADLRITAYRVDLVSNLGAYNSQFGQGIQTVLFSKVLTGIYDIPHACMAARGVYTNTTPVDAYRGAGRPEANLTIERAMDEAARVLGVDGFDLRARNAIRAFPHPLVSGESVDSGDFTGLLAKARSHADVEGFAARRQASHKRGLLRGIGVGAYLEAILGSPEESARVVLDADGGATLYVGTQSNGQGHETVYARMLSDETGIPPEMIRIVQGDSDRIAKGGGTGGSRSVTVQGTATRSAVGKMVAGFVPFLTEQTGQQMAFEDLAFGAKASNLRLTLAEAAALAREKGRADLCDVEDRIILKAGAFPNGCHVVEVEIDPETGAMEMDRYTVVDDFGVQIAPELVAGQVHGGVAQGFGQAVCEDAVYDENGQLLTGSFMDYAMPRATDLPFMQLYDAGVPTATNPLGMKGCGEAGTVGACAAITNAVRDALEPLGVGHVDMPLSPQRIWGWIEEAKAVAAKTDVI